MSWVLIWKRVNKPNQRVAVDVFWKARVTLNVWHFFSFRLETVQLQAHQRTKKHWFKNNYLHRRWMIKERLTVKYKILRGLLHYGERGTHMLHFMSKLRFEIADALQRFLCDTVSLGSVCDYCQDGAYWTPQKSIWNMCFAPKGWRLYCSLVHRKRAQGQSCKISYASWVPTRTGSCRSSVGPAYV